MYPGKYTFQTTMKLKDGNTLGPVTATFEKEDEAKTFPAWWKKFGNIAQVLPLFTAMTRQQNTVNCWGRSYTLITLGLPTAITSQGAPVSDGETRLVVVSVGKEIRVPQKPIPPSPRRRPGACASPVRRKAAVWTSAPPGG